LSTLTTLKNGFPYFQRLLLMSKKQSQTD